MQFCLFCGGDRSEPDHDLICDGKQGEVEAARWEEELRRGPVVEMHARASDPETSHAAMAAYDPERMESAADLVVLLHQQLGPLADYELRLAFLEAWRRPGCAHLYQQARSIARDQGRIRDSGERRVNPHTNRRQVVWVAANEAPAVLEFCPTCGALRGRNGVGRRRRAS